MSFLFGPPKKPKKQTSHRPQEDPRKERVPQKENDDSGWSPWGWSDEWRCEYRSRENRKGALDYDYRESSAQDDESSGSEYEGDNGNDDADNNYSFSPQAEGSSQIGSSTGVMGEQQSAPLSRLPRHMNSSPDELVRSISNVTIKPLTIELGRRQFPSDRPTSVLHPTDVEFQDYYDTRNQDRDEAIPEVFTHEQDDEVDEADFSHPNLREDLTEPQQTASETVPSIRHITAADTSTTVEKTNPNYRVHPGRDFKFGRIFKILWTEPRGETSRKRMSSNKKNPSAKYEENTYTSVRRFVIIRESEGHCICLPILTYSGQATKKHGVKPQHHAIIYTEKPMKAGLFGSQKFEKPKEQPGENLTRKSILMEPYTPRDQLDPLSRLNYAKVYTIEWNVKVCFIGKVHKKSVKYLTRDYNIIHAPLPEDPDTRYSSEEEQKYPMMLGVVETAERFRGKDFPHYKAPAASPSEAGMGRESQAMQGESSQDNQLSDDEGESPLFEDQLTGDGGHDGVSVIYFIADDRCSESGVNEYLLQWVDCDPQDGGWYTYEMLADFNITDEDIDEYFQRARLSVGRRGSSSTQQQPHEEDLADGKEFDLPMGPRRQESGDSGARRRDSKASISQPRRHRGSDVAREPPRKDKERKSRREKK